MNLRKKIRAAFQDHDSRLFMITNDVLAVATIVSIITIVLKLVPSLGGYHRILLAIEWSTVFLFLLEYIARLSITTPKRAYLFSFFGIVDFAAFFPTLIGLGNFTFLKSARVVRITRFLRIMHISKLSRTERYDEDETVGPHSILFATYAIGLFLMVLFLGMVLHVFVGSETPYGSLSAWMHWVFSVFLGSTSAPASSGVVETTAFVIVKFCSLALLGLLIGTIGKFFNDWILGKQN